MGSGLVVAVFVSLSLFFLRTFGLLRVGDSMLSREIESS